MNPFTILQTSSQVLEKSAEIAEKDPYGIILTAVSVSVVFVALIALFLAYTFIGKFYSEKKRATTDTEDATYAAIGMALHQYLNETVHDKESYKITIRRK